METVTCHTYRTLLAIPHTLVLGVTSSGMNEAIYNDSGKESVEKDDLRLALELSGGTKILLDGSARLVVTETSILLQVLCEIPG